MKLKSIQQADVQGKTVLVRADFNVPLDPRTGQIQSDLRIKVIIPTIIYLLERDARIILCSHLGRPNGKVVKALSLDVVAKHLSELLEEPVYLNPDIVGERSKAFLDIHKKDIVLLENLRFDHREEDNDEIFAEELADLADIYINDAFSVCHRKHASVHAITKKLPSYAGFDVLDEAKTLSDIEEQPKKPLTIAIGGSKVSDKAEVIEHFEKADHILLGGALANTFLKVRGYEIGHSLMEKSAQGIAESLLKSFEGKLVLPLDAEVVQKEKEEIDFETMRSADVGDIQKEEYILDIGPKTKELYCKKISESSTIFLAGPMGFYEMPPFDEGTRSLIRCMAKSKGFTVVGGGDTLAMVQREQAQNDITHVSTGGGATLDFLAGKKLPGLEVLTEKE